MNCCAVPSRAYEAGDVDLQTRIWGLVSGYFALHCSEGFCICQILWSLPEVRRGKMFVIQTLSNFRDALWNLVLLTAFPHTSYCNLHLNFFGLKGLEVP